MWVRNHNPTPVDSSSQFDRTANEIMVSLWDAQTHTWSAPIQLTSNNVSDSLPDAYVDAQGDIYVVWLQDTADGNQLMGARHDGISWSSPMNLGTHGLPSDGHIKQVAIGSSQGDLLDVLIAHVVEPGPNDDPGTPVQSRLYNRHAPAALFFQPAYLEQVAENTNFFHLRTLPSQDGLSAYWQQSDGTVDDVYITQRTEDGSWTRPAPLTADEQLEFAPSVAYGSEGNYVLAYEVHAAPIPPGSPLPAEPPLDAEEDPAAPPTAGNVLSRTISPRPEISYTRPAHFPLRTLAPVGSEVTLHAELVNRGFADTDVLVQYFVGQPIGEPVAEESGSHRHRRATCPLPGDGNRWRFAVVLRSGHSDRQRRSD